MQHGAGHRDQRRRPSRAAQGSQRGWMFLPNTSPAARRTTLAPTTWRSSVNAPSKRAIADDVDEPRHAARKPLDLAQRAGREDFARRARDAQAVAHVGGGFVARERIEVIAAGDALRQLAQLDAAQQLAQLGLADQDDLQQLLGFGFEIGEQAHLLEHVGREVLRLVDHQHDALAFGMRLEQVEAQQVDQVLETAFGTGRDADAQLFADGQQELRPASCAD